MEPENGWSFDAPQYVDFLQIENVSDEYVEDYFNYDHENGGVPLMMEESLDEGTPSPDVFSTPHTQVRKITRSASKRPQSHNGTPKLGSAKRVQIYPSACLATENVPTPEIKPIKLLQHSEVDTQSTPSPRVTRSAKLATPNTVERMAAHIMTKVKDAADVKKGEQTTAPSEPQPSHAEKKVNPPHTEPHANTQVGNICSSLTEWRKKSAGAKMVYAQVHDSGRASRKETKAKPQQCQNKSLCRSQSVRKAKKVDEPSSACKGRSPNKGSSLQRARSFSSHTGSDGPGSSTNKHTRSMSRDTTHKPTPAKSTEKHKPSGGMTIPTTPVFMKRKPLKQAAVMKNSEQQELDKIAYFRSELTKKRKQAQESYKVALASRGPTQCSSHTKELTKTEAFKFETDSRIKTHGMETRSESEVKDFASSLRSNKADKPQTSGPVKAGITRPEPFKLSTLRKRKLPDLEEKQAEKYETMAQKLANFTKTPDRFRSKPRGPSEEKRGRSRSPPHGMTIPKTPNLTRTRTRQVTAPNREELEQQEYEEAQKHQFKAHPVNQKVLHCTSVGVKKVASRPATVPDEFHLSSNVKAPERSARKHDDKYEFHAKPLNKKILEGTVGVKEAKRMPATVPESPLFALRHRARIPVVEETREADRPSSQSRAMPHFGLPFQPQLQHRTTEPEPFGFEHRDRNRAEEKARKIEQVYEEEVRNREFHAQPLPDHETHLPAKISRPLTVQKPFNLDTDQRGVKKTAEWNKKMQDEQHDQKEKAQFHARNPAVLEQEPFVPQKENKHTTDFSEFELNTAKRLMKREAFETCKKIKQDELDNVRIQEDLMRQGEARAEKERLRREAVHKANPVKHYRAVAIKPSCKPVTMPMSPKFKTDTRLRSRDQHNHTKSYLSA